jgi:hypothetical protein
MNVEHIKERLHGAIHRSPKELSNKDLEEVLAVAMVAVAALAAEVALVVAELAERVEALERGASDARVEPAG